MVSKKDAGYAKVKTSQKDAGYVTGEESYCCGTCKFFMPNMKACIIVDGKIIYHGCCNFWKKGKEGLTCCTEREKMKKLLKC